MCLANFCVYRNKPLFILYGEEDDMLKNPKSLPHNIQARRIKPSAFGHHHTLVWCYNSITWCGILVISQHTILLLITVFAVSSWLTQCWWNRETEGCMNNTSIMYNIISVYCQKLGTERRLVWLEQFEVIAPSLQSATITPVSNNSYSSVERLLLLGTQVAGYGCLSWSFLVDSEHKNEISKNGVSAYVWFPNKLPDPWLDG